MNKLEAALRCAGASWGCFCLHVPPMRLVLSAMHGRALMRWESLREVSLISGLS